MKFFILSLFLFLIVSNCDINPKDLDKMRIYSELNKFKRLSEMIKAPPAKCPIHPEPVDLPNPLPNSFTNALNQINNTIQQLFSSSGVAGMNAAIVYKGKIIFYQGYGTTNLSTPNAVPTMDTIFAIGSVTKIFPTIMLYNAYEKGFIPSLDVPVNVINNQFSMINPFPNNQPIRFKEIACQLSGLPREAPCGVCNETTSQIFTRLAKERLIYPVYQQPSYSNLGFAIIGRVLAENAMKTTFESWVENNFFAVLGMNSSGFEYTQSVRERLAVGYVQNIAVGPPNMGWVAPAGQAYSTIRDLATLVNFFTNGSFGSNVLEWGTRKQMLLQQWVNPDGVTGFGTPWEIYFQQNYTVRNKGGNVNGYSGLFSVVPELETGIVMQWNGQADEFSFSNSVYDIYLPALVQVLLENKPLPPYPPTPNNYVGTYAMPGVTTATISVYSQNGANVLLLNIIGFGDFFLEYIDTSAMKLYIPQGIQACMQGDLLAANQQTVSFTLNGAGQVTGFSVPGFAYSLYFQKQ